MTIIEFSEWLEHMLKEQQMSAAELSRRSGVDEATISRARSADRMPSPDSLIAIASALKVTPAEAFRAAGLLPPLPDKRRAAEEVLSYKAGELTDAELDDVLAYIEFLQHRKERHQPTSQHRTREGNTPPEVVKD
jgi:transcriptional regulator with XRE-family HTH domain